MILWLRGPEAQKAARAGGVLLVLSIEIVHEATDTNILVVGHGRGAGKRGKT